MIRTGPAGWDYPDWQGVVYPKPKPRKFDPLAYLSRYFGTIEINSTFYRPAQPKVAQAWVTRVQDRADFRFTAKLWRRFTHERATAWSKDEVKETRAGLDVLWEQQRLGAVLMQFPWSFRNDETNRQWLTDLFAAFSHLPLVLEVRHASWAATDVIGWLTDANVGLVNVDQPRFGHSLGASAHATSPVGYVRLHGRNYHEWFRKTAGRDERYDYFYSATELVPWVHRIKQIAAQTEDVYAITNNHRNGQAPANAEMLESMLTGNKVPAPPELLRHFAEALTPYARPSAPP
jgi:uncharacterized protein YecE (DUF72 family)